MPIPSSQSSRWVEIGLHLSSAAPYREWREAPWLRVLGTSSDEPGRQHAFRVTEEEHIREIESAVERWLQDETLPTLTHPAGYLLALRFSTVGHLLMSFEGMFPPPEESYVSTIYRGFLLEWWRLKRWVC